MLAMHFEHVTEVVTAFGRRGVPAERVAGELIDEAKAYLRSTAPVGIHLADQLLLPMALEAGGRYRTLALTSHARTNIEVIRRFLDVSIDVHEHGGTCEVRVGSSGSA